MARIGRGQAEFYRIERIAVDGAFVNEELKFVVCGGQSPAVGFEDAFTGGPEFKKLL